MKKMDKLNLKNKKLLYVRNQNFDNIEANKFQVINMVNFFSEYINTSLIFFSSNSNFFNKTYKINKNVKLIPLKFNFLNSKIRIIYLYITFLFIKKKYDYFFTRDIIFYFFYSLFFNVNNIIYEVHNIPESKIWNIFLKLNKNKLKNIVVISEGLREGLMKLGINSKCIHVFHDGVNIKKFKISSSKLLLRKELDLPLDKKIISYVGNTEIIRDLDTFIQVAKSLKEYIFIVYGKQRHFLKEADKILDNFYFKGFTNSPEKIYAASDILFAGFTNKIKTINYMSPLKLFEYAAAKRPIVVADFPRVREIFFNNEVLYYQSGNIKDLKKQIIYSVKNLNSLSENVEKAHNLVKTHYSWKKRAKKILNLYMMS